MGASWPAAAASPTHPPPIPVHRHSPDGGNGDAAPQQRDKKRPVCRSTSKMERPRLLAGDPAIRRDIS